MGVQRELAVGALRFSLGWTSTADDVDAAVAAVGEAVRAARAAAAEDRR
jgi:cysteine desulfurase